MYSVKICEPLTPGLFVLCCCRPLPAADQPPRSQLTPVTRRRLGKQRTPPSEAAACLPTTLPFFHHILRSLVPPSATDCPYPITAWSFPSDWLSITRSIIACSCIGFVHRTTLLDLTTATRCFCFISCHNFHVVIITTRIILTFIFMCIASYCNLLLLSLWHCSLWTLYICRVGH